MWLYLFICGLHLLVIQECTLANIIQAMFLLELSLALVQAILAIGLQKKYLKSIKTK